MHPNVSTQQSSVSNHLQQTHDTERTSKQKQTQPNNVSLLQYAKNTATSLYNRTVSTLNVQSLILNPVKNMSCMSKFMLGVALTVIVLGALGVVTGTQIDISYASDPIMRDQFLAQAAKLQTDLDQLFEKTMQPLGQM